MGRNQEENGEAIPRIACGMGCLTYMCKELLTTLLEGSQQGWEISLQVTNEKSQRAWPAWTYVMESQKLLETLRHTYLTVASTSEFQIDELNGTISALNSRSTLAFVSLVYGRQAVSLILSRGCDRSRIISHRRNGYTAIVVCSKTLPTLQKRGKELCELPLYWLSI
jgi:hypothetical protein